MNKLRGLSFYPSNLASFSIGLLYIALVLFCFCLFYFFSQYTLARSDYPSFEEVRKTNLSTSADLIWDKIDLKDNVVLSAQLANEQVNVATINSGNSIFARIDNAVMSVSFGYSEATLIDETGLVFVLDKPRINTDVENQDDLSSAIIAGESKKSRTNELFITDNKINLYSYPSSDSNIFGVLYQNLRYPINAIFLDDNKHIWFQIQLAGNYVYVDSSDVKIDKGIPVLTFHHILKDQENTKFRNTSTTTSDTAFEMQMHFLKEQGYRTIDLPELYRYLNKSANLPAKIFVITFDDGLKSVYRYAYPILKLLNFDATVFMISSRIKRHPQSWDPTALQFMSVEEMEKSKDRFNYQSHSHFLHKLHEKKPIIYLRSENVIKKDITRSRRALKQFNNQVDFFAYPFGAYNDVAVQAVNDSGIKMAFSTVKGKVKPGDNLLKLKRIYLLNTDTLDVVAKKIKN